MNIRKFIALVLAIVIAVLAFAFIQHIDANQTSTEPLAEPTAEPAAEPTTVPTTEPITEPTTEPIVEPIGNLELHQINVGCANAYLIISDDITIMIDGGLQDSQKKVINYLDAHEVKYIDAYIATHWHGDHVQNMSAILNKYADASTLVFGPSSNPNSDFSVTKGSYTKMIDGNTYEFGNLKIKCLGPYEVRQKGACNWDSLNFLMTWGNNKFLMTGDYVHSEKLMESHSQEIKDVDVLQFPHHGLKCEGRLYLSTKAFSWINPKIVLVPANSSKPSRAMASSIGSNAKFYDNKSGNVVITSDGDNIKVITQK